MNLTEVGAVPKILCSLQYCSTTKSCGLQFADLKFHFYISNFTSILLHNANSLLVPARVLQHQLGRAGHFRYFFIFSLIKNDFFALFIKEITYFSAPVLFKKPTPSQINLIKNAKNHF